MGAGRVGDAWTGQGWRAWETGGSLEPLARNRALLRGPAACLITTLSRVIPPSSTGLEGNMVVTPKKSRWFVSNRKLLISVITCQSCRVWIALILGRPCPEYCWLAPILLGDG